MQFEWKPDYDALVDQFLKLHFAGAGGITSLFPCMRNEYPWASHRPDVIDSRIPAKNNTEYHGLERHAWQYHTTAQYEFAYHHWLLAACWRREDAMANNFQDEKHEKAVRYCVKQALYNKALHEWQQFPNAKTPVPEDFELISSDIEKKEYNALSEIENALAKRNNT